MAIIKVVYRNGSIEVFDDSKSSHGSNLLQLDNGTAVITDPYGKIVVLPLDTIDRIEHFTERSIF